MSVILHVAGHRFNQEKSNCTNQAKDQHFQRQDWEIEKKHRTLNNCKPAIESSTLRYCCAFTITYEYIKIFSQVLLIRFFLTINKLQKESSLIIMYNPGI